MPSCITAGLTPASCSWPSPIAGSTSPAWCGPRWMAKRTEPWARPAAPRQQLNPPPRFGPIRIAQPALEGSCRNLPRQVGLNFAVLGHLVVGEPDLEPGADGRNV